MLILWHEQVLKAWDIKEQTCLQTVFIKFPISSTVMGRLPEFGPFSMHLQTCPKVLLLAANDHVALLKLGRVNQATSSHPTTHATQLCSAVYNPLFKQVSTYSLDL
jgi:hypothetical protein